MKNPKVTVLLAAAVAATAWAQEPIPKAEAPPTFPSDVELVVVDVVVTAKGGAPLAGMRTEDFRLTEDGVPQEVVSFEAVDVAATPAEVVPESRPRVSVNTGIQGMNTRSFVIVFDQVHLGHLTAERAKAAISEFLRFGPREGDTVTIVGTGGGTWWMTRASGDMQELRDVLKRLHGKSQANDTPDRITDWEAMRIWEDRDPIVLEQVRRRLETYITGRQRGAEGIPVRGQDRITDANNSGKEAVRDDEVLNRAQEVYQQSVVSNRTTLLGLSRVIDSLGVVRGRKTVMLFSEGFIHDTRLEEYDAVIRAAQRSNAAIYFIDAKGLEGMPAASTAQFGALLPAADMAAQRADELVSTLGADTLATRTGGFFVKNTNDLGRGLTRIAQETRRYYLLGYVSTNPKRDGGWRKIDVKVARGDAEVRARKGYYAAGGGKKGAAAAAGTWRPGLQQALDSPYEFQAIPVRVTDHVFGEGGEKGKARALLTTELDVRALAFAEEGGRSVDTVEFLLVVTHGESGLFQRHDQKLELKLPPDVRDSLTRSWLRVSREFDLAPGIYQAKVVVRDKRSGAIGSVSHEFTVPALADWRTSTPILSDALEAASEGSAPRAVIPARRSFAAGATLYFQFEVYGSARDSASGLPRVSSGFAVRTSAGDVVSRGPAAVIRPTADGHLARLGRISLEGLPPGQYELVLDVRDEIAGRTLDVREPFSVESAVRRASDSTP